MQNIKFDVRIVGNWVHWKYSGDKSGSGSHRFIGDVNNPDGPGNIDKFDEGDILRAILDESGFGGADPDDFEFDYDCTEDCYYVRDELYYDL